MTISRITTWVDGQILTASALNAEFDNLINNATALVSPLTADLDFNLNEAVDMRAEALSSAPSTVSTGRIYWDVGRRTLRVGVSGVANTSTDYFDIGPDQQVSRVMGLTGSLSTNVGTFAANTYLLNFFTGGAGIRMTSTNTVTINTQTAGPIAGGRDQAAAFGSTDVHFYAVSQGIGSTTVLGVCSSNPPPTGPTGFQYWAYLCSAKYSTGSSAVVNTATINGSHIWLTPAVSSLSGGTAVVETSVNAGTVVPQIATHYRLNVSEASAYAGAGSNQVSVSHIIRSTAGGGAAWVGSNQSLVSSVGATAHQSGVGGAVIDIPNRNDPAGYYYLHSITIGTTPNLVTQIVGYTVPNGDN